MARLGRVFISHSHSDERLATAFATSIKRLFEDCEVAYSSDKSVVGGVDPGSNWLAWIHEQVSSADESILLLTPTSVRKAWPMWEAGAVAGVALARAGRGGAGGPEGHDGEERAVAFAANVTPVRLQVRVEDLPGPFQTTQSIDGADEEQLRQFVGRWLLAYDHATTSRRELVVETLLDAEIPTLVGAVRDALLQTPQRLTEDLVQEWLQRLQALQDDRREAETRYHHKWIGLAFDGPTFSLEDRTPWDLRVHMRLGAMYLEAKQFPLAVGQFEIARTLAPLDLFVLHRLGLAHLGAGSHDAVEKVLEAILDLDPEAAATNAEVAGLVGRFWKERARRLEDDGDGDGAREAYARARDAYEVVLGRDASSYYMADNVGQLSLQVGDLDGARQAYEKALVALRASEENVWSLATSANAQIVLGAEAAGRAALLRLGRMDVSERDVAAIRAGLEIVQTGLGLPRSVLQEWYRVLDGDEALAVGTAPGPASP